MQENRLQVKKLELCGGTRPTYYLRSSNGHSCPGMRCPESLYSSSDTPDGGGITPLFHARGQMGAHPEYVECRSVMPKSRHF
eukprot:2300257-Pyramimonas_sp.AAC.1